MCLWHVLFIFLFFWSQRLEMCSQAFLFFSFSFISKAWDRHLEPFFYFFFFFWSQRLETRSQAFLFFLLFLSSPRLETRVSSLSSIFFFFNLKGSRCVLEPFCFFLSSPRLETRVLSLSSIFFFLISKAWDAFSSLSVFFFHLQGSRHTSRVFILFFFFFDLNARLKPFCFFSSFSFISKARDSCLEPFFCNFFIPWDASHRFFINYFYTVFFFISTTTICHPHSHHLRPRHRDSQNDHSLSSIAISSIEAKIKVY